MTQREIDADNLKTVAYLSFDAEAAGLEGPLLNTPTVFELPRLEPAASGRVTCHGPVCVGRRAVPRYYLTAAGECVECAASRRAWHPLDGRPDPAAPVRPVVFIVRPPAPRRAGQIDRARLPDRRANMRTVETCPCCGLALPYYYFGSRSRVCFECFR